MTCQVGQGFAICDGQSGGWRVTLAYCPWCKEHRRCLSVAIFGGWCGHDFKCGTCGYHWGSDDEGWRKLTEEERDKNIAAVAARPDPDCWECHDTGDTTDPGNPIDEPILRPCACAAGQRRAAEASA